MFNRNISEIIKPAKILKATEKEERQISIKIKIKTKIKIKIKIEDSHKN